MAKQHKSRPSKPDRFSRPARSESFSRLPRNNYEEPSPTEPVEGMRLNKYVAHCGICSRRQAADLVKQGQISVNGTVEHEPFYQIKRGDVVRYKGQVIQPEERRVYLLMNKPRGVITTASDERGRKTVLDLIRNTIKERVFPVGRLDRDTTGLLLLTNDGELAQRMSHPSYNLKKIYVASLDKPFTPAHLEQLRGGLELEDGPVKVDSAHFVPDSPKTEVMVELHVGRNRIVRRIFEHLGYEVVKLDRTYLGGLTKKDLPRGFFRPLSQQEIIMLRHFTGK